MLYDNLRSLNKKKENLRWSSEIMNKMIIPKLIRSLEKIVKEELLLKKIQHINFIHKTKQISEEQKSVKTQNFFYIY